MPRPRKGNVIKNVVNKDLAKKTSASKRSKLKRGIMAGIGTVVAGGTLVIVTMSISELSISQRNEIYRSQEQIKNYKHKITQVSKTKAEADSLFQQKINAEIAELNKKSKAGVIHFWDARSKRIRLARINRQKIKEILSKLPAEKQALFQKIADDVVLRIANEIILEKGWSLKEIKSSLKLQKELDKLIQQELTIHQLSRHLTAEEIKQINEILSKLPPEYKTQILGEDLTTRRGATFIISTIILTFVWGVARKH